VFGWRLATDTLPTTNNKFRRNIVHHNRCEICGVAFEDGFHATVMCPKAASLRHTLRDCWDLPAEELFKFSGEDWLLLLLDQLDDETKTKTLLLLWRAWHIKNDLAHHQGKETIAHSVAYLQSLLCFTANDLYTSEDRKGKNTPTDPEPTTTVAEKQTTICGWTPPPEGWIKLNTDAAFTSMKIPGGSGAIARDHQGRIVLAACSPLPSCIDAVEAEAKAALLGVRVALGHGHDKIILETDSSMVAVALQSCSLDRSELWATYEETKDLLKKLNDHRIGHVKRESNRAADCLAKLAKSLGGCIWLNHFPDPILDIVSQDLKPPEAMLI